MPQRDYILRLIERFGTLLIQIRRKILGGGATGEEARAELEAVGREAGLELDLARAMSPETLRMLVAPTGEVEPGRCWLFAEILYLDALGAETEGEPDRAWAAYQKALALFGLLEPGGAYLVGFPEAAERVEEIRQRLRGLDEEG